MKNMNGTFNKEGLMENTVEINVTTQRSESGLMNRTLYWVNTRELIENSVQDCLPYILKFHGPC